MFALNQFFTDSNVYEEAFLRMKKLLRIAKLKYYLDFVKFFEDDLVNTSR